MERVLGGVGWGQSCYGVTLPRWRRRRSFGTSEALQEAPGPLRSAAPTRPCLPTTPLCRCLAPCDPHHGRPLLEPQSLWQLLCLLYAPLLPPSLRFNTPAPVHPQFRTTAAGTHPIAVLPTAACSLAFLRVTLPLCRPAALPFRKDPTLSNAHEPQPSSCCMLCHRRRALPT